MKIFLNLTDIKKPKLEITETKREKEIEILKNNIKNYKKKVIKKGSK
jgi:hypothetical protein